jgi:hypothetical protein
MVTKWTRSWTLREWVVGNVHTILEQWTNMAYWNVDESIVVNFLNVKIL